MSTVQIKCDTVSKAASNSDHKQLGHGFENLLSSSFHLITFRDYSAHLVCQCAKM